MDMKARSMVLDEQRVKALADLDYCCSMQYYGSGKFAIIRVGKTTIRDGQAQAVVISESFAAEADAWTDARVRMERV
jgi:hypothetical protein